MMCTMLCLEVYVGTFLLLFVPYSPHKSPTPTPAKAGDRDQCMQEKCAAVVRDHGR